MEYIIVSVILLVSMLIYFKIADKYNIIDKPNHRSAHTQVTLRGGGIIFPLLLYFFVSLILMRRYMNTGLLVWGF
jgi:uncharacterized protein YacL